jgi:hypothetical protein
MARRTCRLALGSNASPRRLSQGNAGCGESDEVCWSSSASEPCLWLPCRADIWDVAGEHPFEHVVLDDTQHRGELGRGDQPLGEVEVVHRCWSSQQSLR